MQIVSQRRLEFRATYKDVVESPWLLPEDKLGSKPGALRFDARTCSVEPASAKAVGED
jgi:hypothetical protein